MDAVFLANWQMFAWLGIVGMTIVAATVYFGIQKKSRKHRFAEYGFEVNTFHLDEAGDVQYAQWLHPKETHKLIHQDDVAALNQYVSEGDLVIDIGAHTGDTTVPLALAAGPTGCTLALEPNPYVFKILEKNASLNQEKTNIVPLNFAATETDGVFTFHYSDGAFCNGGFLSQIRDQKHGHRQPLDVKGRNLENYLRDHFADRLHRLTYIKIDTEGYDRQVITSILGIVKEHCPVIVCEVLKRLDDDERHALFDVLDEAGYECFKQQAGAEHRGERIQRGDMSRWPQFDIVAMPKSAQQVAAA